MAKQLTTQNATITTAAVEVKTLTISGKQVTLAVFRQLKRQPLIADDGTFNGEPWGIVNYHADKCADEHEHWHVVWQHGNELRRDSITVVPNFDRKNHNGGYYAAHTHEGQTVNHYLDALVYMGLRAGGDTILNAKRRSFSAYDQWDTYESTVVLPAEIAGTEAFPVLGKAGADAVAAADCASRLRHARQKADTPLTLDQERRAEEWKEKHRALYGDQMAQAQQASEEALTKLRSLIEQWGGFDAISGAYEQEIAEVEAYREKHTAVRSRLTQLPQLFIAV